MTKLISSGLDGQHSAADVSILLRHPAPGPNEALPTYLPRLAEENGYRTLTPIFDLAGFTGQERAPTSFNGSKLAAITHQNAEALERISLSSGEQTNGLRLLGNFVTKADFDLAGARMCPRCIAETGYVEAHWLLGVMVACPVHRCAAIWFCTTCKKRIRLLRPMLLKCQCGASIQQTPFKSYSQSEFWLLDVIRRKVIGLPSAGGSSSGMPEEFLAKIPLWELLSLVRYLGTQSLANQRSNKRAIGRELLSAATNVLTEWPVNFNKLLDRIDPNGVNKHDGPPPREFQDVLALIDGRHAARKRGPYKNPNRIA